MQKRLLVHTRDKLLLLDSAPALKVALRIVKVSRVQNLNTKFLEHRINAFFKEVPPCIPSHVTSQGCNGILRILPTVVEITNKHVQFPQAYFTREPGISGGVFDNGVTDLFVHPMPKPDSEYNEMKAVVSKNTNELKTRDPNNL